MVDLIPWRSKRREREEGRGNALATLRDEVESVFDRFWRDPWGTSMPALFGRTAVFPHLDLSESDKEITIRAELPGVKPDDIRAEVTGHVLRLSGEKSERREQAEGDCRWSECHYGAFSRDIELPAAVDPNKVDATYKDGILTITLAKRPEARPKRIEVKAQ